MHDLKSRYFRRLVRRGRVPLRPGVARLMQEARSAGLRIAIVTSSTRATMRAILRHSLGSALMQEIELMVCGEEVERVEQDHGVAQQFGPRIGGGKHRRGHAVGLLEHLAGLRQALFLVSVEESIARLAFENPVKLPDQV